MGGKTRGQPGSVWPCTRWSWRLRADCARQAREGGTLLRGRAGQDPQTAQLCDQLAQVVEAVKCPVYMEQPAAMSLLCGHCYCCQEECGSAGCVRCLTCNQPVESRTRLFGAVQALVYILATACVEASSIFAPAAVPMNASSSGQHEQITFLEQQFGLSKAEHAKESEALVAVEKELNTLKEKLSTERESIGETRQQLADAEVASVEHAKESVASSNTP